jgi:hypothetical protein
MNNLPVPVAFVVVAKEPTGAVVVVLFAVIAVVRKYRPAVALAAAAEPEVVMLVAVTAAKVDAPVTVRLWNEGSAYATPVAIELGMMFLCDQKGGVIALFGILFNNSSFSN